MLPLRIERANRAMDAIHTTKRYLAKINTVRDMLLDILYYCEREGINFDNEVKGAQAEFQEEQGNG